MIRVEWLERMRQAIDYMERRMEEPLTIEEIAGAACSSPFHFQRMFCMLSGFTVAEYIRKRRLTLAAQELAASPSRVLDVALKYGYESPEAFAKAFRKLHGASPSEARSRGVPLKAFPRISFHLSLKGDQEMDYRIVEKEAFEVVGKTLRTTCREGENSRDIPKFWKECGTDGTIDRIVGLSEALDLYGICLPMQSDGETFDYVIAGRADAGKAEGGLTAVTIPAATWAVFLSVGPMPGAIQKVWERIFQEWFPGTGYEHAPAPELEVYPPGDVSAADYRCEVWVPIVKK